MTDPRTVRQARDEFLEANGFTMEAYDAPIVEIPLGPVTVKLPNTDGRKVLVRWHDLHHVATGYGTDAAGEAEIGAWELASGCTNLASYVYNGMAVLLGLLVAPVRTFRAFRRARARTLYRIGLGYDEALALPLVELRERMGLPADGATDRPAQLHTAAPQTAL